MSELKKIKTVGQWIAIMKHMENVPDNIAVDVANEKCNEGVIVGLGIDAFEGSSVPGSDLHLGDLVVFQPKRYLGILPSDGVYDGKVIVLMRRIDIVVNKGSSEFEVVEKLTEATKDEE